MTPVHPSPSIVARDQEHLVQLIEQAIQKDGNACSLNHIDLGRIEDLDLLFHKFPDFNGDISTWNTSRVESMAQMFLGSAFNGDISKWDVSRVQLMAGMFENSVFTGDISHWNVSSLIHCTGMFKNSVFNGDIARWDMRNLEGAMEMFQGSKFNRDIAQWKVGKLTFANGMFENSAFAGDISAWTFSKLSPSNVSRAFLSPHFCSDMPWWKMFETPREATLHPDYKGSFRDKYTLDMAMRLFHEEEGLERYLANTAEAGLHRLHIEYILTPHRCKKKPDWCSEQVFKSLQHESAVGLQLGLDMFEIFAAAYQRFKEKPVMDLGVPVEGNVFLAPEFKP